MKAEIERRDAIRSGITICGMSLVVLALLWPLPVQAKAFPLVMTVCIGLGGGLLAVINWRKQLSSKEKTVSENISTADNTQSEVTVPTFSPVTIMVFLAACLLVMPYLGFALTTPVLVFGLLYLTGIRRYLFMILLTLLLEVLIFIGFRLVLYIAIPPGIFDPTEYLFRLFGM